MIFKHNATSPLEIDLYEIATNPDKVYEAAYDHCQEIIQRTWVEDPFLCGKPC